MADAEINKTAWGLIEWVCTIGGGLVTLAVGYLALFLGKKWNKDIDDKIKLYDENEAKLRALRQEVYTLEFNALNSKYEESIDKLEGIETEKYAILDRIKDLENEVKNLNREK